MFLPEGRPYTALVYLGLVALGCFIVILTPLRHLRPHLWTELKSCDTDDSTTTIILGAGVIGLCTAYHLAKTNNENSAKHKVIVVEAAKTVFNASSSTNTGILSTIEFQKDLLPLGKFSYSQWETLGREDMHFRLSCGYREGVNLAFKVSGNESEDQIPDWVHAEPGWHATKDPPHAKQSIINPVTLGAWLYEQCSRYGVEFQMNTTAISARLSSNDEILSIEVVRDNETASMLKSDKLVLATGPWTPVVFKRLFPGASVKFEPVISAGEWFVFENPEPHSSVIAATYFDDIVGEKLEFAGRNDHTIWATGAKSDIGTVPDVGEVPEPDASSLAKLKAYSDAFLNQPRGGLRVIKQGRSYRPANKKQLPIIAGIPSSKLSANRYKDGKPSVYINAGHGSYGVALGMGSGKIMSQLILGEEPCVNVSKLGV